MNRLQFDWHSACAHIAAADTRMAAVIRASRDTKFELSPMPSPFHYLTRAIIYQQLSGKAANTIHGRMLDLFDRRKLTPEAMLKLGAAKLRQAGVSSNKQKALKDLARKTRDGLVPGFAELRKLDDEAIIERLTEVHGVGRWTVEMLLIFQLGRPDVLPIKDLGVRKGLMLAHGMKTMPADSTMVRRAEAWRPFRTVGSWYCWRATELRS